MAHGVTPTLVKVHQILHGYADGHQQLAASVMMAPGDVKTTLVLSDISGPGARIDDEGYLSGYPLPESKLYALARTWAAPEMPRPGCVWTHTLLIDFADLATLSDPGLVLPLFRRPSMGDVDDYRKSLPVATQRIKLILSTKAIAFAKRLLAGLYGNPNSRVIAERPASVDIDSIMMAMWAQQWPRLRRAFRFCTLSAADRSIESSKFDLQFFPSLDRSIRSRFRDAIEIGDTEPRSQEWLDHAISDLVQADVAGLRTFLRRVGSDVDSGREAFRSLCCLHMFIQEFNTNPSAITGAISLIQGEFGTVQARAVREMVVTSAIEKTDQLDDAAIDFSVRNLDFADPSTISKYGAHLGRKIWKRHPENLARMLKGNDPQLSVAEAGFAILSVDELIDGIVRVPSLSTAVIDRRPEVLAEPKFWLRDVVVDEAFSVLARSDNLRTAGLTAMIRANREDFIIRSVRQLGALNVLQAVSNLYSARDSDRVSLGKWLTAAAAEPAAVAELLANRQALSWSLLSALSHLLSPDSVPNDYGVDPWLTAVCALDGSKRKDADNVFLYAYLLTRALGPRSRNPGELAQISFEATHMAASVGRLPDDAWRILEQRLPWSFSWFEWDRCLRIRVAVANLFVEREISPQLFAQAVTDDRLFGMIAEIVARSSRGRRFLKRTYRWMKDESIKRHAARIGIIEELIE